jgi:uncharacterized protein YlzI (FlbEa/FlbD family)
MNNTELIDNNKPIKSEPSNEDIIREMSESLKKVIEIMLVEKEIMEELYYKIETKSYMKKLNVIDSMLDKLELLDYFLKEHGVGCAVSVMADHEYNKYFNIETMEQCFFTTRDVNKKTVVQEKKRNLNAKWMEFKNKLRCWCKKNDISTE